MINTKSCSLFLSFAVLGWLLVKSICASAEDLPESLFAFQSPPASFRIDPDAYRSPLFFENDSPVISTNDWKKRRKQIHQAWMDVMGPWPDLLENNSMQIGEASDSGDYFQHRVILNITPDQSAPGWLLLPKGAGPFPSALVVFYDPETSVGSKEDKPGRDFGRLLAQEGIATLNIGTPGGNAWKPDIGDAKCQPLSFHAYVAANSWYAMANHAQLDASRIGIVGHSYGGKWAMFAAALWERFAAVAVSDPGIVFDESRPNVNYWEPWYLGLDWNQPKSRSGMPSPTNPRTGAYRTMIEKGMDLHELHSLIAPRPFLVSGGSEDPIERWNALHHLAEVNQLLGYQARVFFTQRKGHGPTTESNEQLVTFFKYFLNP